MSHVDRFPDAGAADHPMTSDPLFDASSYRHARSLPPVFEKYTSCLRLVAAALLIARSISSLITRICALLSQPPEPATSRGSRATPSAVQLAEEGNDIGEGRQTMTTNRGEWSHSLSSHLHSMPTPPSPAAQSNAQNSLIDSSWHESKSALDDEE